MYDKKELVQILAENIRVERARKNYSQEYLAEMADISPQHLYRIENAKVCPTIHVVANIAKTLNVNLDCLFPINLK
ncbi:MAG: helix-turn-helix transcriptional regulator [Candidatus Gastranaerophilales bacterium]